MASMSFNEILQIAEDASFIHPDAKKLPAVVHSAVYQKSSRGNDMLSLQFRVTGGPNAGKGRPIRAYLLFDRDNGKQQVANLGYPVANFAKLGEMSAEDAIAAIGAAVVDKACAIDIETGDYNGRPQNNVKWIHPPQAAGRPAEAAKPAAKSKPAEDVSEPVSDEDDEVAKLEAALAARKAKRSAPPTNDLPF